MVVLSAERATANLPIPDAAPSTMLVALVPRHEHEAAFEHLA